MNEEYQHIQKIIQSRWQNVLDEKIQHVFVHIPQIRNDLFANTNIIASLPGEKKILNYKLKNGYVYKPYFPFLELIKDICVDFSEKKIKKILKISDIYKLHQPVFFSYFCNKNILRDDEVIDEELEYETKQIYSSISKLMGNISEKKPLIIILNNLHYATQSTLKLIKFIMENVTTGKILFIYTLDIKHNNIIEDENNMWQAFINLIENQVFIVHDNLELEIKENVNTKNENRADLLDKIEQIRFCLRFYALDECKKYSTNVYTHINLNNIEIDYKYYIILLQVLGDVHTHLQENDTALYYYNILLNYAQENKLTKIIAEVYRKISYIYMKNSNIESCKKLLDQSIILSKKISDESLVFKAQFLLAKIYYSKKEFSSNTYLSNLYKFYQTVSDLGKKLALNNMLCYLYEMMGEISLFLDTEYSQDIKYFDYSIKYSEENKNDFRLASSIEKKGIIYTYLYRINDAFECFKRSNLIKLKNESSLEIAKSFNSIGYLYHLKGNFPDAIDAFHKSLNYLKGIKNYNEIAMTIFNIAQAYFFARNYEKVVQYCEVTIKIMKKLNLQDLTFYSINEIYSMIAIAFLKQNNPAKSYIYYNKIKNIVSGDEEIYYQLLKALISAKEMNYHVAENNFEKIEDIINNHHKVFFLKKNIKYFSALFYYEYGLVCKLMNSIEKANNIFEKGMSICKEIDFLYYHNLFLREISKQESNDIFYKYKDYNYDFKSLLVLVSQEVELGRKEESLHVLHKKINEINFLNNLQNILSKRLEKKPLITDVADLIHHSMLVESTYVFLTDGKHWKRYYASKPIENMQISLIELVKELSSKEIEILVPNVSENIEYEYLHETFSSFMHIPLKSKNQIIGTILCANEQNGLHLSNDDLRIISIASKQLTAALEKIVLIEKLKEMDKIKTQFFSNISHELRTPLTLIISPIETIMQGSVGEQIPNDHHYLNSVHKNSLRLMKLINNILDFSKLEAGKMNARFKKLNINNELKYLSSCLKAATESKKINFKYIYDANDIVLWVDRDMFEKIIMNILSNSFKFTPENGSILLEVFDEDEQVKIKVTDDGCGIPIEMLDKVFEKFMQVDYSNKQGSEGTGIGLSLVKQLIEFHKGEIKIESEVNKGTTITLEFYKGCSHLPSEYICKEKEQNKNKINYLNLIDFNYKDNYNYFLNKNNCPENAFLSASLENYDLDVFKNSKILIVEDNNDMLEYISSLFGNVCTVVKAKDGNDGLQKAKDVLPDIVISDIMMPNMNGYNLCHKIKQDESLSHIPVILLTAKTELSMKIKGYEYGADAYIGKPFNTKEFIAKVYSLLRVRKRQKNLLEENTIILEEKERFKEINAKLMEINHELDKYSRTDVLTGLSNRRDFTEKINYEVARVSRSKEIFSVLMCDIDFFKKVNDTYGHDCGDYVLIFVADIFRNTLRDQDIIARYGGEEFIVLLPNTQLRGAKEIAEKLRMRLSSEKIKYNGETFRITISIGVSVFDDYLTVDECIKLADESLYIAKEAGRNQVISLDG